MKFKVKAFYLQQEKNEYNHFEDTSAFDFQT
jgi:hypothetical protein